MPYDRNTGLGEDSWYLKTNDVIESIDEPAMSHRFVVHEHDARSLHYDFRLEIDGILRSWVIPKGPSMDPSHKRLALSEEDHPLQYADYEGIIPNGHYGAGAVVVWDSGIYEPIDLTSNNIQFILHGKHLTGLFNLIHLKENQWLLIKQKDGFAIYGWKLKRALTPRKRATLHIKTPPC